MKKIISFLKTDIKIINSYFLLLIILIILVCIGYSSYALFSFSKTSTNIIEGTVGELKKKAASELIKLTDNKDDSGLYTITHEADSTLQIGTNEDITEYRYRGASPKNYVTFNNEVWRILGVFPTDDGNGNIENRIKIIKNEGIGTYVWDDTSSAYNYNIYDNLLLNAGNKSKVEYLNKSNNYEITMTAALLEGSNNWARPSTLNTYLNGTYYNNISSVAQQMIGSSKYYLGGYTSAGITVSNMYSYERKISGSGTYYYSTNPNSWTGDLALMYVSDYGYAGLNCENRKLYGVNNDTDIISVCNSTNWLYDFQDQEWLLNQWGSSQFILFQKYDVGLIHNAHTTNKFAVRPTLYLKPNVQIMDGDGTSTNPYVFALDGKVVLPTIDGYEISIGEFIISVTQGTYLLDKYCVLSNDNNPDNCTWIDVTTSSNEISNNRCCLGIDLKRNTNYNFNIFLKDKKNNIVTKSYNYYQSGIPEPCTCSN